MAQTGYTPILIYASGTTTNVPLAANLTSSASGAELALNYADGKLFYKDSGGNVQVLATKGTGPIGGSNTQIQFNNSGALGGSSSLTWDGTYLTAGSIKDSALTSGRVTYAGASGLLQDSANLAFDGTSLTLAATSARILGDFTNATVTSRLSFQTTTANSTTGIYALPNGTSTAASWQATNNSDPTNASKILIATNGSTDVQLVSGINGTGTYLPLTFYTNGAEKMRLDTSGNLGLGVTPSAWSGWTSLDMVYATTIATSNSGTAGFGSNWYNNGTNYIYKSTGYAGMYLSSSASSSIHRWFTAPSGTAGNAITFTQAMTLDASGNLLVGTTSTQSGSQFRVYQASGSSSEVVDFSNNNATYTGVVQYNRMTATGSTSNYLFAGQSNNADKIYIYGNGNIVNSNNSYGSLSDVKLKENITDATPKLAGLLQVRVVNYNLKTEPEHKQLGVIAQELEQVFPSMIDESPDRDSEGNDLGTTTKSVKYSVFVPMLIKAIQEQQAIITQLQADVAALKG